MMDDPPDISIPRPNAENDEVVEYLKMKGFAQHICKAFKGALDSSRACIHMMVECSYLC